MSSFSVILGNDDAVWNSTIPINKMAHGIWLHQGVIHRVEDQGFRMPVAV
jgi:hypothetical protein